MSSDKNHREPKNLDELVDEARRSLKPGELEDGIDWDKLDGALFSRIEAESKPGQDTSGVRKTGISRANRFGGESNRTWQIAGIFATAAAVALALHRPATTSNAGFDNSQSVSAHASPLTLTAEGAADVRVNGELASAGRSLRALDTIETISATADFSSLAISQGSTGATNDEALRVAWRLEDHSQVTVRTLGGGGSPLVIELASGALEAQVTPVERGEAFAVDLRSASSGQSDGHDVVRVAVHGTHLRVSRDLSKNKASIDLSEGVVSIGFPPKSGSTYGTLVTAPAHVEIDLARFAIEGPNAANGTAIVVDKNPAAVRSAIALTTHAPVVVAHNDVPENVEPSSAQSSDENHADESSRPQPSVHVSPAVDPHAEQTIVAAARACAAVHETSHETQENANEVRVSVSSKLTLQVGADGAVRMARFEPPLTPEAQECAGKTIYKTRFAPAATAHEVEVPVDVDP